MRNIEPAELIKMVAKGGFKERLAADVEATEAIPASRRPDFYAGVGVALNFAWEGSKNHTEERRLEVLLVRLTDLLLEARDEGTGPEKEIETLLRTVREQGVSSHNARTRAGILAVIPHDQTRGFYSGLAFGLDLSRRITEDAVQELVLGVHLAVVAELLEGPAQPAS